MEVVRKWKQIWKKLVERGEVEEEVVEVWSEAVKDCNGLEYVKFADLEIRYSSVVVDNIRKLLLLILGWNTDHIEDYEPLSKVGSRCGIFFTDHSFKSHSTFSF
jgi:hypothetical protein